jgi:hypothetical protein
MRTKLPFLTGLHIGWLGIIGVSAQCPQILNCPQGSPVLCDFSPNDPLLWKAPPYTWSPVLESEDLYEGSTDFFLKILPCADGGNTAVSCVLFLDLDNDNLGETAVSSLNFPPVGVVYADNAFNPGYSGGEVAQFDKRPVADSLKYRFAIELTYSWDTLIPRLCWQSGSQYVAPRLPEGRHRNVWRVEQDGTVKYCEHSFRIKDCEPPALGCEQELAVNLNADGKAGIVPADLYSEIQDNTTPFQMMELSMRKAGTGTGFPVDSAGNAVTLIDYDCESPDTQFVELWAKDRPGNAGFCQVMLHITDDAGACAQAPLVCARTFWGTGDVVQSVAFKTIWVDTGQKLLALPLGMSPEGCGMLDALPPSPAFSITATCDTNPLNGVSTFDLLLISRHILGVQALDAPWKWIAADANKNGSITTFDLVEFRKLILGIYTKLPANTSWRFFPADCVLPPNPFSTFCPPEYSFVTSPLWQLPAEVTFNAVKIGDVNGSASASGMAQDAASRSEGQTLLLPDPDLQAGKIYDVPVRIAGTTALSGFQLGLHIDPALARVVSLESTLAGFNGDCWVATDDGALRLSWVGDMPRLLPEGDAVFTLRLRALEQAPLYAVIRKDESRLRAEYYPEGGTTGALDLEFRSSPPVHGDITPAPNPTTGGSNITFQMSEAAEVELFLCDFAGRYIFRSSQSLAAGKHILEIPAAAFPGAGIYGWSMRIGKAHHSGKLVRY